MKTDRKKIKPKQSVRSLKAKVWDVFSKYIRTRDCIRTTGDKNFGHCITCSKFVKITKGDAGHFIPRDHSATLFDETNVHLQCRYCNRFKNGEPLKYRRAIEKLYGEGHDYVLEEKAMTIKRFTIPELERLLVYYKEKLKEVE